MSQFIRGICKKIFCIWYTPVYAYEVLRGQEIGTGQWFVFYYISELIHDGVIEEEMDEERGGFSEMVIHVFTDVA